MFLLLKSFYLYAVSLWVGSLFFFTVIGAPMAFRVFEKEEAGRYTGAVFPKYFGLSYVLGLMSLVSFYLLTKENMGFISSINLLLLLIMNVATFANGFLIVPRAGLLKAEFYRSGDRSYYDRFLRLHSVSMVLNGLTLIFGLMVLGITSLYLTF